MSPPPPPPLPVKPSRRASDRQIAYIEALGGYASTDLSSADASLMIDALQRGTGPTPRQMMVLRFWDRQDLSSRSKEEISAWMDKWYRQDLRRKVAWELWKSQNNGEELVSVPIGAGHHYIQQIPMEKKSGCGRAFLILIATVSILAFLIFFMAGSSAQKEKEAIETARAEASRIQSANAAAYPSLKDQILSDLRAAGKSGDALAVNTIAGTYSTVTDPEFIDAIRDAHTTITLDRETKAAERREAAARSVREKADAEARVAAEQAARLRQIATEKEKVASTLQAPTTALAKLHFRSDFRKVSIFGVTDEDSSEVGIIVEAEIAAKTDLTVAARQIRDRIIAFSAAFWPKAKLVRTVTINYRVLIPDGLGNDKKGKVVEAMITAPMAAEVNWKAPAKIRVNTAFRSTCDSVFQEYWTDK